MNLTNSGRAFYHQSVRILEDVLEAELAKSQAHGTLQGSLKIALPSTYGLMHMGPAINEFLQAHLQIEFDLDFNDRIGISISRNQHIDEQVMILRFSALSWKLIFKLSVFTN